MRATTPRSASITVLPVTCDGLRRDALGQQVVARRAGGGEMQFGQRAGQLAVALLGPGRIEVARAQARLDMGHGDPVVVAGEAGGERRRRVAVHQHDVRTEFGEHAPHALQDRGR